MDFKAPQVEINFRYNVDSNRYKTLNRSLREAEEALSTEAEKIISRALIDVRDVIIEYFETTAVPKIEPQTGTPSNKITEELKPLLVDALLTPAAPQSTGKNRMGILSKTALDAVKITDYLKENEEFYFGTKGTELMNFETEQGDIISISRKGYQGQITQDVGESRISTFRTAPRVTTSPYDILWRIIEFGTGAYAHPRPRATDDGRNTKVGGKGHWIFGPLRGDRRIGPVIVGQKGMHFLIETRKNVKLIESYNEVIRNSIQKNLRDIFGFAGRKRGG